MQPHPVDVAVALLASQQAGNFSVRQVLAAGGNRELIRRRVRAGRWLQHAPGVCGLPGFPDDESALLWRAWLDAGPYSMVSHTTAAALQRIDGYRISPVRLLVPHGFHHHNSIAAIHQTRRLPSPTIIRGLPVTPVVRTGLDLAGETGAVRLGRIVDQVVLRGDATLPQFREGLEWMQRTRRPGATNLERALRGRTHGYEPPRSELERMLDGVISTLPCAPPEREVDLPGRSGAPHRVDRRFRGAMVIVEGDGRLWHARLQSMDDDRRRDRHAARLGYRTLRRHRSTWTGP